MITTSRFILNNDELEIELNSGQNTLDFLRKERGLFGTKEGCREGECGACTVILGRMPLVSYRPMPSCLLSAGQLDGTHLITIEGLDMGKPNRLQQAFIDEGASQCGFCTPGFIMSLTGYLMSGRVVTVQDAVDSLDGNICRCTGYASIRRAVEATVKPLVGTVPSIEKLIDLELLPASFAGLGEKLKGLQASTPAGLTLEWLSDLAKPSDKLVLSGGTDLYVRRGDAIGKLDPLFLIPESSPIERRGDNVFIPATASMEQLRLNSELNAMYPGLDEKLLLVASYILRNRATVAGNLVNASPIADSAVLLLAWNAEIILAKPGSAETRKLPLREFFLDYKKLDMKQGEYVQGLLLPLTDRARTWNFEKVSKRERLDIASCNSAAQFSVIDGSFAEAGLAFGGVAAIPYTAVKTMTYLTGKPVKLQTMLAAFEVLQDEIQPIDDVRGSASYKRKLASAQLASHFIHCFPDECSYSDFAKGGVL